MNWIKRLFGAKNEVLEVELPTFITVDYCDLVDGEDGIAKIQTREIDGFLIKNVLTQNEVNSILNGFNSLADDELENPYPGLYFYPQAFSQIDQKSENSRELLQEYYLNAEKLWSKFDKDFGFDYLKRIKITLGKLAGGRAIDVPKGIDNEGMYNPATIKRILPEIGELKAHCGNFFHAEFPLFFGHLEESTVVKDQLSYFTMLAPSDSGGELTVYNIDWKNVKKRLHGDTVLEGETGEKYDLMNESQVGRIKLNPQAGDMIVFAGGEIWHKVEHPLGDKPRYTIGGFISRSKDNQTFYIWS